MSLSRFQQTRVRCGPPKWLLTDMSSKLTLSFILQLCAKALEPSIFSECRFFMKAKGSFQSFMSASSSSARPMAGEWSTSESIFIRALYRRAGIRHNVLWQKHTPYNIDWMEGLLLSQLKIWRPDWRIIVCCNKCCIMFPWYYQQWSPTSFLFHSKIHAAFPHPPFLIISPEFLTLYRCECRTSPPCC